ncbi:hypothetical protein NQZ68_002106 [Dissostichus eleginoides]|nr:hypothetical protein NQZ68_002106 [Dissostichus eleginoides]
MQSGADVGDDGGRLNSAPVHILPVGIAHSIEYGYQKEEEEEKEAEEKGHGGGGQFLHSNNDKTSQFNTRQAKGMIAAAEQEHTDFGRVECSSHREKGGRPVQRGGDLLE